MIAVVTPAARFTSYAQNREDVVLWRALGDVQTGRYVEVGANRPLVDSVSRPFYDRGWSGITIEPMREFATAHRAERPRDTMIEAVITDRGTTTVVLHEISGTGLSTIVDSVGDRHAADGAEVIDKSVKAFRLSDVLEHNGGLDQEVQFMIVDTEGSERDVLASVDLTVFRPWVLVIESTAPNSVVQTHEAWEGTVLDAGYAFCLFDGLSRFYVAREHAERLQSKLSYPACPLDDFIDGRAREVWKERERSLLADVERWRAEALERWAQANQLSTDQLHRSERDLAAALKEVEAVRASTSWRVTRPLRAVGTWVGRR